MTDNNSIEPKTYGQTYYIAGTNFEAELNTAKYLYNQNTISEEESIDRAESFIKDFFCIDKENPLFKYIYDDIYRLIYKNDTCFENESDYRMGTEIEIVVRDDEEEPSNIGGYMMYYVRDKKYELGYFDGEKNIARRYHIFPGSNEITVKETNGKVKLIKNVRVNEEGVVKIKLYADNMYTKPLIETNEEDLLSHLATFDQFYGPGKLARIFPEIYDRSITREELELRENEKGRSA